MKRATHLPYVLNRAVGLTRSLPSLPKKPAAKSRKYLKKNVTVSVVSGLAQVKVLVVDVRPAASI